MVKLWAGRSCSDGHDGWSVEIILFGLLLRFVLETAE